MLMWRMKVFELTKDQQKAFALLKHHDGNIFLTGAAGTGKSELIRRLRTDTEATIDMVASTGVAAVLVGGRTFHSFFGIGLAVGPRELVIAEALAKSSTRRRLGTCRTIIIDEVSMLSGRLLSIAEEVARKARNNPRPWGGIRVIAVGDFAQLPPVDKNEKGQPDWAFTHPVWEYSGFATAYLGQIVRTSDLEYMEVLGDVRRGLVTNRVTSFLRTRPQPGEFFDGTRLYGRRADADYHNAHCLAQISGQHYASETKFTGDHRYFDKLAANMPIPPTFDFKIGALVMVLINDPDTLFVNGSLGIVTGVEDGRVVVRLHSLDIEVPFAQHTYEFYNADGDAIAAATNFPLRLAWASTIHKAQGMSVDRICASLSSLWDSGQFYVAISRSKSPEGVFLENWDSRGIIVDPLVTEFYRQHEG